MRPTTTPAARGSGPCKRCRPEEAADPAWARDLIEAVERAPRSRFTDDDLRALGIEPARARRYFREHFGMTFHAFHRVAKARPGAGRRARGRRPAGGRAGQRVRVAQRVPRRLRPALRHARPAGPGRPIACWRSRSTRRSGRCWPWRRTRASACSNSSIAARWRSRSRRLRRHFPRPGRAGLERAPRTARRRAGPLLRGDAHRRSRCP